MGKNITIVAGPCAVESEEQIMNTAYKIGLMRDVARPYGIDFKLRGGAWKPRTSYLVENGGNKERVFEGKREGGLQLLAQAAKDYDLPIVSELMSEMDVRYFQEQLDPERDYIQIGARTSQAFALLFQTGVTGFGVVLKNPQHGVDMKEALGSIERLRENREVVYCIRGQKRFIHPHGTNSPEHEAYMSQLAQDPSQHPDARNLNNIRTIEILRNDPRFENIKLCYDPSHTWGGKTHEMRRRIGESSIEAIVKYGYAWIIVEVDDKSKVAKCDKEQALATTLNGIDWSETYVEEKPPEDQMPLSLANIVTEIMKHQVQSGNVDGRHLKGDKERIDDIKWDESG